MTLIQTINILSQMSFQELRHLIDYCLGKEKMVVEKYSSLITADKNILFEYLKELEKKILLPKLIPDAKCKSPLPPENPQKIIEKRKSKLQKYYQFRSNALKNKNQKNFNRHNKKIQIREENMKKILIDYENALRIYGIELKEFRVKALEQENCRRENQAQETSYETKRKIVARIFSDIENFNQSKIIVNKLNWKLLPKGEIPFYQLKEYLQSLSKFADEEFDYEKIDKIISLQADKIYCGADEFEGYLVFYFEKIRIAVLDCPKKGNAIYIFGENWENLSCLTKSELLNYHSDKTERIIHRGEWFEKLKLHLRSRYRYYQISI